MESYYKLDRLKQQRIIVSLFRRLEVWNQDVTSSFHSGFMRENLSHACLLASVVVSSLGALGLWLVCPSIFTRCSSLCLVYFGTVVRIKCNKCNNPQKKLLSPENVTLQMIITVGFCLLGWVIEIWYLVGFKWLNISILLWHKFGLYGIAILVESKQTNFKLFNLIFILNNLLIYQDKLSLLSYDIFFLKSILKNTMFKLKLFLLVLLLVLLIII